MPLTFPFKNFNRATFTTYYIKKAAAKFTLNRVLLMFTFVVLKFFINLSRLLQRFFHVKPDKAPGPNFMCIELIIHVKDALNS